MAERNPASYRDPAGFIFEQDGILYRQVNLDYKPHYDHLMQSGAYSRFTAEGSLITHQEVAANLTGDSDCYKTLLPQKIPLITYAYEWSFGMLKDAALLTLRLARDSMQYGMILKDASPSNVQWLQGSLRFIDTLSFIKHEAGRPWIAYRQFCECFLSPLLLMSYTRSPLQPLMLAWPEGIPLAVTARLLPFRARFSLGVYLHIILHAGISSRPQAAGNNNSTFFSEAKLKNILDNLISLIEGLRFNPRSSTWINYYDEASARESYLVQKQELITRWLANADGVQTVADFGANEGVFSRIAAGCGKDVIAADMDALCIDRLYQQVRKDNITSIQPLVMDLANPSPASGFHYGDRGSFTTRCKADLVLALALIHHLCIGHNIPLNRCAAFFSTVAPQLIIEFVPPADEKAAAMIDRKEGVHPEYTEAMFEIAFLCFYTVKEKEVIPGGRTLWFLVRKATAPALP